MPQLPVFQVSVRVSQVTLLLLVPEPSSPQGSVSAGLVEESQVFGHSSPQADQLPLAQQVLTIVS